MTDKHPYRQLCREELADWRDLLPTLTDEQWQQPSLCEGFTVGDVVAHLTVGRTLPLWKVPASLARHGFSMDRWAAEVCPAYGALHERTELIAIFQRETVRTREHGLAGIQPPKAKLSDNLTHRLDICWPLGIAVDPPAGRVRAVLDALVGLTMWGSEQRAAGLRFEADDVDWRWGSGAAVTGPAQAMVLALGGRPAGLEQLDGPGASILAERLGHAPGAASPTDATVRTG